MALSELIKIFCERNQINPAPAFFSKIGNTFGDDFVIESTFPGGHDSLVDTIITSRMRFDTVTQQFNKNASDYHKIALEFGGSIYSIWSHLFTKFEFGGTVLDLGCGTGYIGGLLQMSHKAKVTGIDASPEMTNMVKNYEKVYVGLIENVMLELNSTFDHIVSCGALMYCCKQTFELIFSKMFTLATQSITISVEDIDDKYISESDKKYNCSVYNHLETIKNFPVPTNWIEVYNKYDYFWESPRIGSKVSGIMLRYERVKN